MGNRFSFPWYKVPLLFPLFFLIIGIAIDRFWIEDFSITSILFVLLLFLISDCIVLLFFSKKKYFNRLFLFFTSGFCIVLGILVNHNFYHPNKENWYGNYLEDSEWIQVKIIDYPEEKARTIRYKTEVNFISTKDKKWYPVVGNLDVYIYKNEAAPFLKIYDVISFSANKLSRIQHNGNPHSFNYEKFAADKNKFHQAFLGHQDIVVNYLSTDNDLTFVNKINRGILKSIYDNVSDSMTASLMSAVIINERTALDKDVWDDYSRTGVVHIIAISGMHITLFVTIVFFLLSFIKNKKYEKWKYGIAIGFVWLYVALTGLPPSAVRAGIMFTIIGIGIILDRKQIAYNTLFFTAFLSLLIQPNWLWDVGFQLSFLSVLSIFLFFEPIKKCVKTKKKIVEFLWSTIAVSISVQILLTPLLIYYFHQFTIWSVVANVPAALYSTLFMVLTLLIIVLGFFDVKMIWLGDFNTWITYRFNEIIHFLSDYSPDFLHRLRIDVWTMCIWYIGIALFIFYFYTKRKNHLWIGIILCISGILKEYVQYTIHQKQQYLCLYNINSKTIIDVVNGSTSHRFYTQEMTKNDSVNILLPHEINQDIFHVNSEHIRENKALEWNGKKLLILQNDFEKNQESQLHFDYVILTNKELLRNTDLFEKIKSKEWILSSEISTYQVQNFKERLPSNDLKILYIREFGAKIIQ